MPTSKEVATTEEQGGYLSVIGDSEATAELIKDNIGDSGLDRFSLNRVKVPAGGGVAWAVPTIEGVDSQKEVTGVIIWWTTMRAYWEKPMGEGEANQPPDCSSQDGHTGVGNPGGSCDICPLNEFGTAAKGKGKACKEVRAVFMLPEGAIFPYFFPLPPMSIGPLKQYFLNLTSSGNNYWKVVTAFTLEQARNAEGIVYSKVNPRYVRKLEPAEVDVISAYRAQLRPHLEGTIVIDRTDIEGDAENLPFE